MSILEPEIKIELFTDDDIEAVYVPAEVNDNLESEIKSEPEDEEDCFIVDSKTTSDSFSEDELESEIKSESKDEEDCFIVDSKTSSDSSSEDELFKIETGRPKRNKLDPKTEAGPPFQCEKCGKSFKYKQSFQIHELTHSEEKSFQCHQCGECVTSKRRLQYHLKHYHSGKEKEIRKEKRIRKKAYNCEKCGMIFYHYGTLLNHKIIHTEAEKEYNCGQCEQSFVRLGDYQKHMKTHPVWDFKCNQCEKSFSKVAKFQLHLMSHQEEKPFKCDYCGKTFLEQHTLQLHKEIHNPERPYKCDVCGKGYKQKHILVEHKKIHLKDPQSKKASNKIKTNNKPRRRQKKEK